jgi:hypothetical protein
MDVSGRFRRHLARLRRSERGMALPTALFALIASFGLASAAILTSVNAQRGTNRDNDSKNAIAAADAGASVALLRLNRFQSSLTEATPCVGPAGEAQTPSGGWCPATTPETVGGSTYSYRISAYEPDSPLSVVAVGTADGVSRRVEVGLMSYDGENVFADEHLIGQDGVEIEGTPDIFTDIGTNGDITMDGTGTLCGDVRHGNGKSAPEPDCDGDVSEGNRDLPELTLPENIETENSNCRLVPNCTKDPKKEVDSYSKARTKDNPWYATNRTINVSSSATLTMGGEDYFVCGLYIDNGTLIMPEGSHVRIFVDTPEHCGLEAGDVQIRVGGNGNIKSTGYNPKENKFDVIGIYVLGSPDIPTTIELTGGSDTNELVLYAPNSDIDLDGNATWVGMVAGKSLRIHGTPEVKSDPGIAPPDIKLSSLWERTRYVECVGATATPPDANC